jgi:protein-S-isoprenylcysteine O-methyltransferase Ste14
MAKKITGNSRVGKDTTKSDRSVRLLSYLSKLLLCKLIKGAKWMVMDNGLHKKVIFVFFLGLALMVVVELGLVWAIERRFISDLWHLAVALPLVGCGLGWVIWTVRTLYISGKGTPAPRVATKKLVQAGPYRYSRNPMTLGASWLYLGLAVGAGSWVVFGLVLLIFTALLFFIYTHESRELEMRFGVEYLDYRRATPFLFPRFPP